MQGTCALKRPELAQRDRPEVLLRPAGRDAKGVDIDTFAWHPQQQDQLICSCTDKVVRCAFCMWRISTHLCFDVLKLATQLFDLIIISRYHVN